MKENTSSNNSSSKVMRKIMNHKLYTEQKANSAFKIVIPDMETMVCCETLAPSNLEKEIVSLGKSYKSDFTSHFNPSTYYNYVI
jgi:hypothetical protein